MRRGIWPVPSVWFMFLRFKPKRTEKKRTSTMQEFFFASEPLFLKIVDGVEYGVTPIAGGIPVAECVAHIVDVLLISGEKLTLNITGTGAAMLIASSVTDALSIKEKKKIERNCPDGCYETHHRSIENREMSAITTDMLLVVESVTIATEAGLLIYSFFKNTMEQGKEKTVFFNPLSLVKWSEHFWKGVFNR